MLNITTNHAITHTNFTLRYFPHLYIVRDCAHMVGGSS